MPVQRKLLGDATPQFFINRRIRLESRPPTKRNPPPAPGCILDGRLANAAPLNDRVVRELSHDIPRLISPKSFGRPDGPIKKVARGICLAITCRQTRGKYRGRARPRFATNFDQPIARRRTLSPSQFVDGEHHLSPSLRAAGTQTADSLGRQIRFSTPQTETSQKQTSVIGRLQSQGTNRGINRLIQIPIQLVRPAEVDFEISAPIGPPRKADGPPVPGNGLGPTVVAKGTAASEKRDLVAGNRAVAHFGKTFEKRFSTFI